MPIYKIIRIPFLILITVVMVRCIEPYEPEVVDYESILVVDGLYNNSDNPSIIILSRSFGYEEDIPEYIDNAQVIIEDDLGKTMNLLPMGKGLYQTDPLTQRGEIGRSYRLLINAPGGSRYASEWETMLPASPIGEVKIEYQERELNDPDAIGLKGTQIFLSNEDTEREVSFYKWEFEETYQYIAIYNPDIQAVFGSSPGGGEDEIIRIPLSRFQGPNCYKTETSTEILIASTEGLLENKISRFPLAFVSNETPRLYLKYSSLIKQFSISKKYHENLRKIAEINQTSGSLFDPIPNEIFGNIKSIDNEREPVLGYFGVGGFSEKRIFIDRRDLPLEFSAPFGPHCEPDTLSLDFNDLYHRTKNGHYALSTYELNMMGNPVGYIISAPECVLCSASNATHQVPDFW
ncbi:MAG: hypothetical protein ACI9FN_002446 [Saprospiraceae bacterium]|jgi:hypothetical protein